MASKTTNDAVRDACVASTTPAAFARALGKDGRSVRNVLRSKFGVYVSKGATFDVATREALYAYLDGDAEALQAWRDAQ